MKNLILLVALLCVYNLAYAVPWKNAADESIFGNKNTLLDKMLSFDVGDGASNPKISVDVATKKFNLNKNTKVTGTVQATAGMVLGNGTAADQSITVDRGGSNPVIKWSEADSSFTFTNDGTLYKKFGSGSGGGSEGGINILINPGFEDNLYDWSASSGVASVESSDVAVGAKALLFDGAVNGDYVESTFADNPTPQGVIDGYGCMADFLYKGGDNLTTIEILDGSSNLLTSYTIPAAVTVWTKSPTLTFPCGTQNKIKFKATGDAAAIRIDQVYLGNNKNLVSISKATVAADGYFATTANCQGWTRSSAVLGDVASDADCPGPTWITQSVGNWLTTDTDLPQFTGTNLPPGRYVIHFGANITPSTTQVNSLALTDGTTVSNISTQTTAADPYSNGVGVFTYTSFQSSVTFKYQVAASTGSVYINNNVSYRRANFTVMYYPLNSSNAYAPESNNFFIDANIGGANPSLGTSAVTTYTGIVDAGLDIVNNTTANTQAQIACATTEESSGLTCTGNESIGFSAVFPRAGKVKVCADFAQYVLQGTAAGVANTVFQLVKTGNNNQTILSEGNSRLNNMAAGASASATYKQAVPLPQLCGIFPITSIGKHTFRLFYEQEITATITTNTIQADRSATAGQRDIHFTAWYIDENTSRPYLTGDQVRSRGLTNPEHYSCTIISSGGNWALDTTTPYCAAWLSSTVIDGGTGIFTVSPLTTPAYKPVCTCSLYAPSGTTQSCNQRNDTTTTAFIFYVLNAGGSFVDQSVNISCDLVR